MINIILHYIALIIYVLLAGKKCFVSIAVGLEHFDRMTGGMQVA
jgi:hypothetical protein